MGDESGIAWTKSTFNPWIGCQRISPACEHCYAEAYDRRGLTKDKATNLPIFHWGPSAPRRVTSVQNWNKPRRWNREAQASGERWFVFCASLADVFEDRRDLDEPRAALFRLIGETPALTWQLLTKRTDKIMALCPESWRTKFPPNVWMGTTVESQKYANERIPHLLMAPATVRFLSVEPQIEGVNLTAWLGDLQWIIQGGESGAESRSFDLSWAHEMKYACSAFDVPYFLKQLGRTPTWRGEPFPVNDSHGGDWSEWPADLRVRELPMAEAKS